MTGIVGNITKVTVSVDICVFVDSDLQLTLIGPNGQQIASTCRITRGGNGQNFSGTIFDDCGSHARGRLATGSLHGELFVRKARSSPYSMDCRQTASGRLEVDQTTPDGTLRIRGSQLLNSWSLTITTNASEPHAVTDANGNYTLRNVASGNYNIVRSHRRSGFVQNHCRLSGQRINADLLPRDQAVARGQFRRLSAARYRDGFSHRPMGTPTFYRVVYHHVRERSWRQASLSAFTTR